MPRSVGEEAESTRRGKSVHSPRTDTLRQGKGLNRMKKIAFCTLLALVAVAGVSAQITEDWNAACGVLAGVDDVRNMASNGTVLVTINRTATDDALRMFNLTDGTTATPASMDMGTIPAGTYNILEGEFADDGAFYACNLAYASPQIFRVYRWANTAATPVEIYNSGAWSGYRLGDALAVRGSGVTTRIVATGNSTTSIPLILTTVDGTTFTPSSATGVVKAVEIDIVADNSLYTTDGGDLDHYAADGTVIAMSEIVAAESVFAMEIDETWGVAYTVGIKAAANLYAYSLATGAVIASAEMSNKPADFGVANGSCEVVQLATGPGQILTLAERHGVSSFSSTIPVELSVFSAN